MEEITNVEQQENPQGQDETVEAQAKEQVEKRLELSEKELQSEIDKAVTKALKTRDSKWEEKLQERIEKERSEAERLATMSHEERLKAEIDAERKQFEDERKLFLRERLELETVKQLQTEGLPTNFSGFVIGETADVTNQNIKAFKDAWVNAIENAVNERLKGDTPKSSNGKVSAVTLEEFRKMGYHQRVELQAKNPELYAQLNNR
jgi:Domain of unknown function (DUF4355)